MIRTRHLPFSFQQFLQATFGCIALVVMSGCGSALPANNASTAPPLTQPAMRPISYFRTFAENHKDEIRLQIDAAGSYQIVRKSIGGMHSTSRGVLTPEQSARLIWAFNGWESLDNIYPHPGAAPEEYYYEIGYGGKIVSISDAALNIPPKVREVMRVLQSIVATAGLL